MFLSFEQICGAVRCLLTMFTSTSVALTDVCGSLCLLTRLTSTCVAFAGVCASLCLQTGLTSTGVALTGVSGSLCSVLLVVAERRGKQE